MCGKMLRDFGLDVIKIEPPGGDPVRRMGPFKDDLPHLEGSLRFAYLNGGKKSLTLDITRKEGRDLLLQLVERADVLIESAPPGAMHQLGLGSGQLCQANPRLQITSVSSFGVDGPYAGFLGPDMVAFAMGGLMSICGDAALPPTNAPETQSYYYASIFAALGTLLALWERGKDAQARSVDVSIQETIASQEHMIRTYATDGESIVRHGSQHEHVAPANIFPTADGYVYLFVTRAHWKLLLDFWDGHPAHLDAPDWLDNDFRHEHEAEINELVSAFTRRFTRDDLTDRLQKAGIPSLPVNTPTAFMNHDHIRARQLFQPVDHPYLGAYSQTTFPLIVDGARAPAEPPPTLGQHTREILQSLGLSTQDLEVLFAQGII